MVKEKAGNWGEESNGLHDGNLSLNHYSEFLDEVKEHIRSSQYRALRTVNKELVVLYWDIGRLIVDRQEREGWGRSIVVQLAADLRNEFPKVKGFSRRNVFYMREFFLTYCTTPKVQPLVAQIGWSHNLIILQRCKDMSEREFYIINAKKFGWTKNVLKHQIENQSYEKTFLGQSIFHRATSSEHELQEKLAIRDSYTFDFLELGEEHSERDLERALLTRIEDFLREMGGSFAFMGSQFRLQVGNKECFVDLVLFHRHLRCLVAIELKVGEFKPEYVGKMQFYLTALNRLVREDYENPSIGIILCKEKDRTMVEYALHDSGAPIGVATYRIVKHLPKDLEEYLPGPDVIA